jgi:rubredoxin
LLYTKDFNPNSKDYTIYRENIKPALLSKNLISLCKDFYNLQGNIISSQTAFNGETVDLKFEKKEIYQCNNCFTRYDKVYGDCVNSVERDIEFTTSTEYYCPVCESPKSEFSLVE